MLILRFRLLRNPATVSQPQNKAQRRTQPRLKTQRKIRRQPLGRFNGKI